MNPHDEEFTQQECKSFESVHAYYFFFGILFLVVWGCYNIIHPYLHTIILAGILGTLFSPLEQKITKLVGGRKNLAALLSCLILTLVVVIPLVLIGISLIRQGVHSFSAISEWIRAGNYNQIFEMPLAAQIIAFTDQHMEYIRKVFPGMEFTSLKVQESALRLTSTIGQSLVNQSRYIVGNFAAMVGNFFLMIFVFFFFVRDYDKIAKFILHLSPLSRSHELEIISRVKGVARSALLGSFLTAIAQGAAGGFAFWIVGLPGLFWGTIMAFASLIPLIGTALIWVPAAGYLFIAGQWKSGIFMVLWCVLVVGMLDNFVRPLFMKEFANMSSTLVFFSILGGVNYFGLIGLLYGPMLFGLAIVLLYIYALEFGGFLDHQDKT